MTCDLLIVAPTHRELAGADRLAPTAVVGIGDRCAEAASEAIAIHQPDLVLSIGFSGGLDNRLKTGDIVISENAVLAGGTSKLALSAPHSVTSQQALAAGAKIRAILGDVLTTTSPLLAAADKLAQGRSTGAAIVDMETYWIANAAAQANVPVLSVRTVIDAARDNLPKFVGDIMADSGRNEVKHALRALRNPANIGPMLTMAMHARKAIAATRAMLDVLVPTLTVASNIAEAHQ